jgi:molecular chaperone GrpE
MEGHRNLDYTEEQNSSRNADETGNTSDNEDRAALQREREKKLKRSKTRKTTRSRENGVEEELSDEDLLMIPQESDLEFPEKAAPEAVFPAEELFPAGASESALITPSSPPSPLPEEPKLAPAQSAPAATAPVQSAPGASAPAQSAPVQSAPGPTTPALTAPSLPQKDSPAVRTQEKPSETLTSQVPSDQEKEKLDIGVEELINVIKGVPVLDFLNSRIVRAREKGLDYPSMLGFYRITSRMMKEEYEKKKEHVRKIESDFDDYKKRNEAIKGGVFGFMQTSNAPAQSLGAAPPPPPAQDKPVEKPKPEVVIDDTAEKELFLLRETVKQRESKLDEYMDLCERLKNDFNNFRNRASMEITHQVDRAAENLIVKFLPVLDNFERALKATGSTTDMNSVIQGIGMIHYQFEEVLKSAGVQSIKALGEPFDPKIHEALAIEETEEQPDDTVMEEIARGYMLKTRVLRPSLVKVAKNNSPREAPPPPAEEVKPGENKAEESRNEVSQ